MHAELPSAHRHARESITRYRTQKSPSRTLTGPSKSCACWSIIFIPYGIFRCRLPALKGGF